MIRYGSKRRVFKTLPVGRRPVELEVTIPRLACQDCRAIRQAHLEFADPKKHYTRSLEQYAAELCRVMTIQEVAKLTGLGWDTVKEIDKSWLRRQYGKIKWKQVRYLALDEVYLGKKRKFITIALDLETGRVLHIGKGKGKDALKGLWRRLKRAKAKIQAVATDMASGYMAAVLEHLPKADLVLDHFHLVKWFNDKLTRLRRQLYRQANDMEKEVLKGSRWLLLKAPENLRSHENMKKDERARLQEALELNEPLARAYYMKERLRVLFDCGTLERAEAELDDWIRQARTSDIAILQQAAQKLLLWKPFILNWYKHPISTGKLEVTNRKIGLLQRQACGYRDEEYLNLRILHLHQTTYSLAG